MKPDRRITLRLPPQVNAALLAAAAKAQRLETHEAIVRLAQSLEVACPPLNTAGNPQMRTTKGAKKLAKKAIQARRNKGTK